MTESTASEHRRAAKARGAERARRRADITELDPSAVLRGAVPRFALLYRGGGATVDVLTFERPTIAACLDSLPWPARSGPDRHELLVLLPYRQLLERGLAGHDDGTPLVALPVRAQTTVGLDRAVRELPDQPADLVDARFDLDDAAYADIVRRVVADEIGQGEGSNFVIRRTFTARITNHSVGTALSVFRRLLERERGTYWTFIVHDGQTTLVGATPEPHLTLRDGVAAMTPISGTYRYPPGGPSVTGLLDFLADGKETDELAMVVDEELKMLGPLCPAGPRVTGPRLREMARLAHTEYRIHGHTEAAVPELLRATMFAPTVTGSPLASACRVITRYERTGRGYYGGVLALVGREHGRPTLDSAIAIRTAEIDSTGRLRLGVGSTLVRHSDPWAEVAETRAKAATVEAALRAGEGTAGTGDKGSGLVAEGVARTGNAGSGFEGDVTAGTGSAGSTRLGDDPRVQRALAGRNARLARFWFDPPATRGDARPELVGRRVAILDAEDGFTAMLAHQVRSLGPMVDVLPYDGDWRSVDPDLVLIGPGPGDPADGTDRRIAGLRRVSVELLTARVPVLAVCLGHQVLASVLGLALRRQSRPRQGGAYNVEFDGTSGAGRLLPHVCRALRRRPAALPVQRRDHHGPSRPGHR